MNTRYCFALDLRNDPTLITEYEEHHKNVWPEVIASIKESGIEKMAIYRAGNRLFMIVEANEIFSLENKQRLDAANPIVQKWEMLMSKFQQPLPYATQGEKWMLMDKIFSI
jgi:L-rhamnose mutarotase